MNHLQCGRATIRCVASRPLRFPRAFLFLLTGAVALAFSPHTVTAQVVEPLPTTVPADSVAAGFQPSPRGAFLRSLVLPGWGQTYVGSPGRGGAYFAMEAGSLWMLYRTRQRLDVAREQQEFLRGIGTLEPEEKTGLVESREAQQEDWLTLALFIAFFSGADAYVGALLADFDTHVGVLPAGDGGLRLQANFPVGRRP